MCPLSSALHVSTVPSALHVSTVHMLGGTRKTRRDIGPNASGPAARALSGGKTRNRARGEGRRADVVARVQWDLLPAQVGNDGSVERVRRCYACLVGRAAPHSKAHTACTAVGSTTTPDSSV